jgi:hypothetical protein
VADHIAAINAINDDLAYGVEAPRASIWPWLAASAVVVLLIGLTTAVALRRRTAALPVPPAEPVGISSQ